MKFIVSIVLTALLSFAFGIFLPWWSIAIAALVVAFAIHQTPWKAFLTGFLGVFLLWFLLVLSINTANDSILAAKVSVIILKSDSPAALMLVTALIGGVVGGFGALTGSLMRRS